MDGKETIMKRNNLKNMSLLILQLCFDNLNITPKYVLSIILPYCLFTKILFSSDFTVFISYQ